MTSSPDIPEATMNAAKDVVFDFDCDWSADGRRRGDREERDAVELVARALLAAEKRGEDRERERCAKIAEAVRAKAEVTYGDGDDDYIGGEYHAADRIAADIRSNGGGNG